MIKNLHGTHEIITFNQSQQMVLHDNRETENYPPHWHTPFEIILPTESNYTAICNDQAYTLGERDILIICPGCIHELLSPSPGRRIIFQIHPEATSTTKELESITAMIFPAIHINSIENPEIHQKLYPMLLEIEAEFSDAKPFYTLTIYTKFMEIMTYIGRSYTQKLQHIYAGASKQKEYIDKFIFICNYITEHCTEDLSLEKAADLAGFSKYHFSRLFKQFSNVSFYRYLNLKRITHAQNLLINPELSVTEVALHSGFPSVTSFIRMFKLLNNCTPTEFRKMYLGGLTDWR